MGYYRDLIDDLKYEIEQLKNIKIEVQNIDTGDSEVMSLDEFVYKYNNDHIDSVNTCIKMIRE
jgi:hypothetical protein